VQLGGTARALDYVTVTMSDWALYADYSSDGRYTNAATWTHPITVNVYSTHLGTNGAPDTLLATTTQDVAIPWRPVADPRWSPNGTAAFEITATAALVGPPTEGECVSFVQSH
jgi:hypothetical protein